MVWLAVPGGRGAPGSERGEEDETHETVLFLKGDVFSLIYEGIWMPIISAFLSVLFRIYPCSHAGGGHGAGGGWRPERADGSRWNVVPQYDLISISHFNDDKLNLTIPVKT